MTLVISESATTSAPPEEVWKLLYDPSRFASWWHGVTASRPGDDGRLLLLTEQGVMPQRVDADRTAGRVTVSCLSLGLEHEWSLSPLQRGGTRIAARCLLPEREQQRAAAQRAAIAASLRRLGELAAAEC